MNRPQVLHLIHHLRVGGAEMLLLELLPRLVDAGFDVHIACLDDRGPIFDALQKKGIPAHFIGRQRGFDVPAILRLTRLLRELRIDILNTHSFSAGFWGRLAAILARTPHVVTTVHTVAGWSQPIKQRLGNRLLRPFTDRIVAVSESVRHSIIAQGAPEKMVQVIHNGICIERFSRTTTPVIGLPPDRRVIGFVGRCSPEKGGDLWLKALSRLEQCHGVLVGSGPELNAWKALAEELGITHRVTFAGEQMDIVPWLAAFDIMVCPSRQESFGLVALEAQAAGVPVVATRVDGFLEVLHNGEDAILVDSGNPVRIEVAIRSLLGSPAMMHRLISAGRLNAQRFTINQTSEAYASLYHHVLTTKVK